MRTPECTRERVRISGTYAWTLYTPLDTSQSAPHLAHQRQRVVLTVVTLGQPQIMIRHPRDNVGLSNKLDAPRSEDSVRTLDVVDHIVNDRGAGPSAFWTAEHQPHATAIEERQSRWYLEQQPETERIAVEPYCTFDIAHDHQDLPDAPKDDVRVFRS